MKSIFLFVAGAMLSITALIGCHKSKSSKQYSIWYINGTKYQSNDVTADIGHAVAYLSTPAANSEGFQIVFNEGILPQSGSFLLECDTPYSNHVCLNIIHGNTSYGANKSTNSYLQGSASSGGSTYTLDSVWFINHANLNDSILVSGTFIQP